MTSTLRSAVLGEGSFFVVEDGLVKKTNDKNIRSNIVDVACTALVTQGDADPTKTLEPEKQLSYRDWVRIKEAFDNRFKHQGPIRKALSKFFELVTSLVIFKKLPGTIEDDLRKKIQKLHPESILGNSFFKIEGEKLTRTYVRKERSSLDHLVKHVLDSEHSCENLSFGEVLQLENVLHAKKDNQEALERLAKRKSDLLDQAREQPEKGKDLLHDILWGYFVNSPMTRMLSRNKCTYLITFVMSRITSERGLRKKILKQLKVGPSNELNNVILSCLHFSRKTQEILAHPEAAKGVHILQAGKEFVPPDLESLVLFLEKETYAPGELQTKLAETYVRLQDLQKKKNLNSRETMELSLLRLLEAKAFFHARKVVPKETKQEGRWFWKHFKQVDLPVTTKLSLLGIDKDTFEIHGLSKDLFDALNNTKMTSGASISLSRDNVEHVILKVVDSKFSKQNKITNFLVAKIEGKSCVFVYNPDSGELSPYKNSNDMEARLLLAKALLQENPIAASQLLEPNVTLAHSYELTAKGPADSDILPSNIKKMEIEIERATSLLTQKTTSSNALVVQLRTLSYLLPIKKIYDEASLRLLQRDLEAAKEEKNPDAVKVADCTKKLADAKRKSTATNSALREELVRLLSSLSKSDIILGEDEWRILNSFIDRDSLWKARDKILSSDPSALAFCLSSEMVASRSGKLTPAQRTEEAARWLEFARREQQDANAKVAQLQALVYVHDLDPQLDLKTPCTTLFTQIAEDVGSLTVHMQSNDLNRLLLLLNDSDQRQLAVALVDWSPEFFLNKIAAWRNETDLVSSFISSSYSNPTAKVKQLQLLKSSSEPTVTKRSIDLLQEIASLVEAHTIPDPRLSKAELPAINGLPEDKQIELARKLFEWEPYYLFKLLETRSPANIQKEIDYWTPFIYEKHSSVDAVAVQLRAICYLQKIDTDSERSSKREKRIQELVGKLIEKTTLKLSEEEAHELKDSVPKYNKNLREKLNNCLFCAPDLLEAPVEIPVVKEPIGPAEKASLPFPPEMGVPPALARKIPEVLSKSVSVTKSVPKYTDESSWESKISQESKKKALREMAKELGIEHIVYSPEEEEVPSFPVGQEHKIQAKIEKWECSREAALYPKPTIEEDPAYQEVIDHLNAMTVKNREKEIPICREIVQAALAEAKDAHVRSNAELSALLTKKRIGAASVGMPLPSLETLYVLYAQNNYEELQRFGISLDTQSVQALKKWIGRLLSATQDMQKANRVLGQLNDLSKVESVDAFQNIMNKERGALEQARGKREYDPAQFPAFQLYEMFIDSYVSSKQFENIGQLLDPDKNVLLQQLMGSGKTFILIPLLALARANGENISIAMFPDPLLKNNLADIQRSLGGAMRELVIEQPEITSSMSVEELEKLHGLLLAVQKRRGVLFFSPEKMHVLLNTQVNLLEDFKSKVANLKTLQKRLELLRGRDQEEVQVRQVQADIEGLSREIHEMQSKLREVTSILSLLKAKGAVVGDEADELFKTSLQYIISVGDAEAVSEGDSKLIGDLIFFITEHKWPTSLDFLRNESTSPYLSFEQYDHEFLPALSTRAVQLLEENFQATKNDLSKLLLEPISNVVTYFQKDGFKDNPGERKRIERLFKKLPIGVKRAIEQAAQADSSTITAILNKYDSEVKNSLQALSTRDFHANIENGYLLSSMRDGDKNRAGARRIDGYVDSLPPELAQKVRDIRRVLFNTLHSALNSHCREEYGVTPQQDKPWPTPFSGPMCPATTQFSSPQEVVIKTLQAYINQNIPPKYFLEAFKDMSPPEVLSFFEEAGFTVSEQDKGLLATPDGKKKFLEGQYAFLEKMHHSMFTSPADMNSWTTYIRFLRKFVETITYPAVEEHKESIVSNSQKLWYAFHSVAAFTGTLWNKSTQPSWNAIYPDSWTAGDFFMKMYTKSQKEIPEISTQDFGKKQDHITSLCRHIHETTKCNALIDNGGWLRDAEVNEFAKMIFKERSDITSVVYHDLGKKLVEIRKANDGSISDPIPFENSKNSDPKRFTIYAKQYCVGTDIKQEPDALAFQTVGPGTTDRDASQGTARMRQIAEGQSVVFAYDDEALKALEANTGKHFDEHAPSYLDFIEGFLIQEAEVRLSQNQQSTRERMKCQIEDKFRTLLNKKILEGKFDDVFTIYQKARDYFVTTRGKGEKEHIPVHASTQARMSEEIREMLSKFTQSSDGIEWEGVPTNDLEDILKSVIRYEDLPSQMTEEEKKQGLLQDLIAHQEQHAATVDAVRERHADAPSVLQSGGQVEGGKVDVAELQRLTTRLDSLEHETDMDQVYEMTKNLDDEFLSESPEAHAKLQALKQKAALAVGAKHLASEVQRVDSLAKDANCPDVAGVLQEARAVLSNKDATLESQRAVLSHLTAAEEKVIEFKEAQQTHQEAQKTLVALRDAGLGPIAEKFIRYSNDIFAQRGLGLEQEANLQLARKECVDVVQRLPFRVLKDIAKKLEEQDVLTLRDLFVEEENKREEVLNGAQTALEQAKLVGAVAAQQSLEKVALILENGASDSLVQDLKKVVSTCVQENRAMLDALDILRTQETSYQQVLEEKLSKNEVAKPFEEMISFKAYSLAFQELQQVQTQLKAEFLKKCGSPQEIHDHLEALKVLKERFLQEKANCQSHLSKIAIEVREAIPRMTLNDLKEVVRTWQDVEGLTKPEFEVMVQQRTDLEQSCAHVKAGMAQALECQKDTQALDQYERDIQGSGFTQDKARQIQAGIDEIKVRKEAREVQENVLIEKLRQLRQKIQPGTFAAVAERVDAIEAHLKTLNVSLLNDEFVSAGAVAQQYEKLYLLQKSISGALAQKEDPALRALLEKGNRLIAALDSSEADVPTQVAAVEAENIALLEGIQKRNEQQGRVATLIQSQLEDVPQLIRETASYQAYLEAERELETLYVSLESLSKQSPLTHQEVSSQAEEIARVYQSYEQKKQQVLELQSQFQVQALKDIEERSLADLTAIERDLPSTSTLKTAFTEAVQKRSNLQTEIGQTNEAIDGSEECREDKARLSTLQREMIGKVTNARIAEIVNDVQMIQRKAFSRDQQKQQILQNMEELEKEIVGKGDLFSGVRAVIQEAITNKKLRNRDVLQAAFQKATLLKAQGTALLSEQQACEKLTDPAYNEIKRRLDSFQGKLKDKVPLGELDVVHCHEEIGQLTELLHKRKEQFTSAVGVLQRVLAGVEAHDLIERSKQFIEYQRECENLDHIKIELQQKLVESPQSQVAVVEQMTSVERLQKAYVLARETVLVKQESLREYAVQQIEKFSPFQLRTFADSKSAKDLGVQVEFQAALQVRLEKEAKVQTVLGSTDLSPEMEAQRNHLEAMKVELQKGISTARLAELEVALTEASRINVERLKVRAPIQQQIKELHSLLGGDQNQYQNVRKALKNSCTGIDNQNTEKLREALDIGLQYKAQYDALRSEQLVAEKQALVSVEEQQALFEGEEASLISAYKDTFKQQKDAKEALQNAISLDVDTQEEVVAKAKLLSDCTKRYAQSLQSLEETRVEYLGTVTKNEIQAIADVARLKKSRVTALMKEALAEGGLNARAVIERVHRDVIPTLEKSSLNSLLENNKISSALRNLIEERLEQFYALTTEGGMVGVEGGMPAEVEQRLGAKRKALLARMGDKNQAFTAQIKADIDAFKAERNEILQHALGKEGLLRSLHANASKKGSVERAVVASLIDEIAVLSKKSIMESQEGYARLMAEKDAKIAAGKKMDEYVQGLVQNRAYAQAEAQACERTVTEIKAHPDLVVDALQGLEKQYIEFQQRVSMNTAIERLNTSTFEALPQVLLEYAKVEESLSSQEAKVQEMKEKLVQWWQDKCPEKLRACAFSKELEAKLLSMTEASSTTMAEELRVGFEEVTRVNDLVSREYTWGRDGIEQGFRDQFDALLQKALQETTREAFHAVGLDCMKVDEQHSAYIQERQTIKDEVERIRKKLHVGAQIKVDALLHDINRAQPRQLRELLQKAEEFDGYYTLLAEVTQEGVKVKAFSGEGTEMLALQGSAFHALSERIQKQFDRGDETNQEALLSELRALERSMAQKVELADTQAFGKVQGENEALKSLVEALPQGTEFSNIRKEQAKVERQLAQFQGGFKEFQSLLSGVRSYKEKFGQVFEKLTLAQVRSILDKGVAGEFSAQLVQVENKLIAERKEQLQVDLTHLSGDLKNAERGTKVAVEALLTRATVAKTEADFASIEGECTALQEAHRNLLEKAESQSQQLLEVANRLAASQPFSNVAVEQKRVEMARFDEQRRALEHLLKDGSLLEAKALSEVTSQFDQAVQDIAKRDQVELDELRSNINALNKLKEALPQQAECVAADQELQLRQRDFQSKRTARADAQNEYEALCTAAAHLNDVLERSIQELTLEQAELAVQQESVSHEAKESIQHVLEVRLQERVTKLTTDFRSLSDACRTTGSEKTRKNAITAALTGLSKIVSSKGCMAALVQLQELTAQHALYEQGRQQVESMLRGFGRGVSKEAKKLVDDVRTKLDTEENPALLLERLQGAEALQTQFGQTARRELGTLASEVVRGKCPRVRMLYDEALKKIEGKDFSSFTIDMQSIATSIREYEKLEALEARKFSFEDSVGTNVGRAVHAASLHFQEEFRSLRSDVDRGEAEEGAFDVLGRDFTTVQHRLEDVDRLEQAANAIATAVRHEFRASVDKLAEYNRLFLEEQQARLAVENKQWSYADLGNMPLFQDAVTRLQHATQLLAVEENRLRETYEYQERAQGKYERATEQLFEGVSDEVRDAISQRWNEFVAEKLAQGVEWKAFDEQASQELTTLAEIAQMNEQTIVTKLLQLQKENIDQYSEYFKQAQKLCSLCNSTLHRAGGLKASSAEALREQFIKIRSQLLSDLASKGLSDVSNETIIRNVSNWQQRLLEAGNVGIVSSGEEAVLNGLLQSFSEVNELLKNRGLVTFEGDFLKGVLSQKRLSENQVDLLLAKKVRQQFQQEENTLLLRLRGQIDTLNNEKVKQSFLARVDNLEANVASRNTSETAREVTEAIDRFTRGFGEIEWDLASAAKKKSTRT